MSTPELPLQREMREIHECLRRQLPGVDRVAAALYDASTDTLRTFAHSTAGPVPLERYESRLADSPSLCALVAERAHRVLDDVSVLADSPREHTRRILECGYRSSYTQPFYDGDRLLGMLFLDSRQPAYFRNSEEWLPGMAHLVGMAVAHRLAPARLLDSALRVVSRLTHYRDPETRSHLDRMAHYTHLIAHALAPREGLSDEYLQFLLLFAPMHDVGKIGVPDHVLLKPARLTPEELAVMQSHVTRGAEIVEGILADLRLENVAHATMLRNVVLYHHEAVDGTGYPHHLAGTAIPLEARIVAVADVFDALTSRRPYKPAWSLEDALRYLGEGAGRHFDPDCVAALAAHAEAAEEIRLRFPEGPDSLQSREGYTADL